MTPIVLFLITMIPGTVFLSAHDVLNKKLLRSSSEHLLLGFSWLFAGIIYGFILLVTGIPEIQPEFWRAVFTTAFLNVFGMALWYRAFKEGEVSTIAPMRLLVPVVVIGTGFLFLGERPSIVGVLGIAITLFGLLMLLHARPVSSGSGGLFRVPGMLWALLGVIAFSLSFPFDKLSVVSASSLMAVSIIYPIVGGANLVWAYIRGDLRHENVSAILRSRIFYISLGCIAVGGFLVIHALQFALVAYASSVKRIQALWSVLLAGVFLKEKVGIKVTATLVMLAGILVTVIGG